MVGMLFKIQPRLRSQEPGATFTPASGWGPPFSRDQTRTGNVSWHLVSLFPFLPWLCAKLFLPVLSFLLRGQLSLLECGFHVWNLCILYQSFTLEVMQSWKRSRESSDCWHACSINLHGYLHPPALQNSATPMWLSGPHFPFYFLPSICFLSFLLNNNRRTVLIKKR